VRLYFSFGSNMDRAHMARLCRGAEALGTARLDHHQFFIAHAGYASIAHKRGAAVHGVLWKVTAAHIAKLDAYESVAASLYRETLIPVHHGERLLRALAYVASDPRPGRPKPGYQEGVIAAARAWQLPKAMCASWKPSCRTRRT
jgi:gamma-glutamylcyclotransferase (GGCT)/AIG2-like uncharacterized protein YtfP